MAQPGLGNRPGSDTETVPGPCAGGSVGAKGAQAAHDILKWTFELKTLCSLEFVRSQDGSEQRFDVAVGRRENVCYAGDERSWGVL